jgi:DNA-binding GntR family transcriptional regulator
MTEDKPAKIQRVPPYAQIAAALRDQIEGGTLRPGDPVPSVRKLAEQYNVSTATADKALSALRSEGLLIGGHGVVSTVATPTTTAQTGGERWRRMMATGRATRPGERSEIQSSELVGAPDDIAEMLGLDQHSAVIRRVRHFIDERGLAAISTSWLDANLAAAAPALLDVAPIDGGTIGAVRAATGRTAVTAVATARARLATPTEAEAFGLESPAAVLVIGSEVTDLDGAPIEYGVDVIAPGRTWPVTYDLTGAES